MARSRSRAAEMIAAGIVAVDGVPALKPSTLIHPDTRIRRVVETEEYVSRGGAKLAPALDHFRLEVGGLRAVDVGSSTGGFTDCLLRRGAASVVCVDVGTDQLAPQLRAHPSVCVWERTDIRSVSPEALGAPFDLVVADLSFISLRHVVGHLADLIDGGSIVGLVKPQFELDRSALDKRGVVMDGSRRADAVQGVIDAFAEGGLTCRARLASTVTGGSGNQETFVLMSEAA